MKSIVIGGSTGIGLEVCKRLLELPEHTVFNVSRSISMINHPNHHSIQLDITCKKNYSKFISEHDLSRYANIVYCVGDNKITTLEEINYENIDTHFELNVKPFLILCSAIARTRRENNKDSCSVVAVGSIWSSFGLPGRSLYGSTKSALTGFVKHASTELSKYNCSINVVSPGFTDTKLTSKTLGDGLILDKLKRVSGGNLMNPSHVATHIIHLLQPFNYCITGSEIFVDLGFSNHA